jgi:hypothetical protein
MSEQEKNVTSSSPQRHDFQWQPRKPTCYPQHPPGSRVVLHIPEQLELPWMDRLLVSGSSLVIVGAVAWVPYLYYLAWKKYRSIPQHDKKRRRLYAACIGLSVLFMAYGPHRSRRVGQWLQLRKWKLWDAWMRYIALQIIVDNGDSTDAQSSSRIQSTTDPAILTFVPHGIFPFAFAFGALPEIVQPFFGVFRPVVATAIELFPLVRTLLRWLHCVDASRSSVDAVLQSGDRRIGIVPGGIAEMYQGYPKPNTHPNEEYAIIRPGLFRLAIQHQLPVIPIYCFGSTKFFRQVHAPVLERLSVWLRVSVCLFYGVLGLPIPFRQRLQYVMGRAILPPITAMESDGSNTTVDAASQAMQEAYCRELERLFYRHKDAYGWSEKVLKLMTK